MIRHTTNISLPTLISLRYARRAATPEVRRDVSRMIAYIRRYFITAATRSNWVTLDPSLTTVADEKGMLFDTVDRADQARTETLLENLPELMLILQNGTVDLSLLNETLSSSVTKLASPGPYTDGGGHPIFVRLHHDKHDITLVPYSLLQPVYDINAPASLNYGGLGSEVALAFFELLFHSQQIQPLVLESKMRCFLDTARAPIELALPLEVRKNILMRAASLEVLWFAFKLDTANSPPALLVEMTSVSAEQLVFVMWCYMQCGDPFAEFMCNLPLRHSTRFPAVFRCSEVSYMKSSHSCEF